MVFKRKIEKTLQQWKLKENPKPLLLRGARQVGKSTLVKSFGEDFATYIELNLEKSEHLKFFEDYGDDVSLIMEAILLEKNLPKQLGRTLLFIDEIQESPRAIKLLRYFYEELPELRVIAAGSLLEFAMSKVKSFPVGRVLQLACHPMDFEEFLIALDETQALQYFNTIPLPDFAYPKLLSLFHEYARVGGMPEAIKTYIQNERSIISLQEVYSSIWDNYLDDVEKYTTNDKHRKVIRHIMDTAPGIRDRITYANFGGSSYKSREVSESFRLLNLAKIIRTVYPTTDLQPPLSDELKRKPKIQFLDTGIMNYAAGIQDEMLAIKDLNSLYKGYIVNHMANQELIAQQDNVRYKLHFWLRENANANAEVDIAIRYMQHIIPVEVKSGAQGRLRSLHEFIDRVDHSLGIRLLANRVKVESSKTRTNKQFTLLNLPYFLVSKLSDYIEWVNEKYELGLE